MQIRFLNLGFITLSIYLLSLIAFGFSSCKKEDVKPPVQEPAPSPSVEFGNVNIEFVHVVDNELLDLGKAFIGPAGDTFIVNKFNYYISNIVFVKEDNSLFTQTNSYYLIEESKSSSKKISIGSVPFGKYKSIRFLLGVDSTRNVSGAQTGALDPAKGMFWNWSTGYIMLKLEGTAPTSTVMGKNIEYHMGGFKGINKVQRNIEINFSASGIDVAKGAVIPLLKLQTNVNEIFKNPNTISFSSLPVVTSAGANAKLLADNYEDMITLKSIE
ncbi:MAG: hypothetical protein MUF75_03070 [Bacteroidia bacterium]|nr:hypothetical protein [Bacteroidia bacterium]